VGPRAGLDAIAKRKIVILVGYRVQVVRSVASQYSEQVRE